MKGKGNVPIPVSRQVFHPQDLLADLAVLFRVALV